LCNENNHHYLARSKPVSFVKIFRVVSEQYCITQNHVSGKGTMKHIANLGKRRWYALLLGLCVVAVAQAGVPRWIRLAALPQAVDGHATVMLRDGAVFTVGGFGAAGAVTDATSIVDPVSGIITNAQPLPQARARFATVVVSTAAGSDVYVIGGYTGSVANAVSSARVDVFRYDATTRTGTWRAIGSLDAAVADCRAVFDGISAIVVTGGTSQAAGAPGTGTAVQRSWTINTTSFVVTRGADLTLPRSSHATLRYIDAQNRPAVLTAGGEAPPPTTATELLLAGLWDARTNPPRQWRNDGGSVTDRSGTARVFGGRTPAGVPMVDCEFYDPKSGWRAAPRMAEARAAFGITAVSGPTDTASAVLVAGGATAAAPTRGAELFMLPSGTDPVGGWEALPQLVAAAASNASAMSAWNLPTVSGGRTAAAPSDMLQILQPLNAPDITLPPTEVAALSDSVILRVTNTWVLPVHIDRMVVEGTAEFIVAFDTSAPTLAAGATRNVLVFFRPATEGPRSGRLVIHIGPVRDTVQLRGTGLSSTVSLTTSGIDVGDVIVTTQRDTCINLVVNQGTDTLRIDSLRIDDADVTITSPLGRPRIAPGDTLRICLRYRPTARRVLTGALTIHIGGKLLPVAVTGRGVRRFVVVQSRPLCDTITATVGSTLSLVANITNPSDRVVRITDIRVTSTTAGTVVLDPAMTFPVNVPPGGALPVLLVQTVIREGREDIVLTTVDDGDTVARGTICTVPRSRAVQLDASVIDLGVVCGGQTVDRVIRLENASSIETIVIDNISFANILGTTGATLPLVLQPRTAAAVPVTLTIPDVGNVDGRISFDGAAGSVVASVVGTIAPSADVVLQTTAAFATGGVARQAIVATPTTTQNLEIGIGFNARALAPRAIALGVGFGGTVDIDRVGLGRAALRVALDRAPATGEVVAFLDWDVLRADVLQTVMTIGPTPAQPCVASDTITVDVDPLCGGSAGLVFAPSGALFVRPQSGSLVVHVVNANPRGVFTVYNLQGQAVITEHLAGATTTISGIAEYGVYSCVYRGADGVVVRTLFHNIP